MDICTIVASILGIAVTVDLAASAYVVHRIGGIRVASQRIKENLGVTNGRAGSDDCEGC